jgi:hypothetical protein
MENLGEQAKSYSTGNHVQQTIPQISFFKVTVNPISVM